MNVDVCRWFELKSLLHLHDHATTSTAAATGAAVQLSSNDAGGDALAGVELHPVVALAVGAHHRQQLLNLAGQ